MNAASPAIAASADLSTLAWISSKCILLPCSSEHDARIAQRPIEGLACLRVTFARRSRPATSRAVSFGPSVRPPVAFPRQRNAVTVGKLNLIALPVAYV